jgi:hypothetical protein
MDVPFFNLFGFILVTLIYYYFLKPKLTLDILSNAGLQANYTRSGYFMVCIYFLLILLTQFGINSGVIINKCGGSVSQNLGVAGLMTFLPWVLIFGVIILILIIYPGFKSAFSDVVGYFYVSNKAKTLFNDLLVDINSVNKIESSSAELEQKGGADIQEVSDLILKLYGNMSIIINQIVPSNFLQYMGLLKPLMKPKYESDPALLLAKEEELLKIVSTRDNIGEAFWYTYTGILIISITQYYIHTRPCVKDEETMQSNYQQFLEEEEATNQEKAKGQGAYKITN